MVELWLTSEDLGAYGHDIGVTLPELLWQLVGVVPAGCMLRLGMTNPPYIMEHMEVQDYSSIQCAPAEIVAYRPWYPSYLTPGSTHSFTSQSKVALIRSCMI